MSKEEADWYRGKASALLRLGKFDAALTNYESARETYAKGGLKRELTEALSDAGFAYLALGDRLGAEKKFQQAITVSRAIDYERGIVINQLALAKVLRDAREYARASKNAETALADARKLDDSAEIVGSLLLIAGILSNQHHLRAAYETAEQARERSQRDGLRLHFGIAHSVYGAENRKVNGGRDYDASMAPHQYNRVASKRFRKSLSKLAVADQHVRRAACGLPALEYWNSRCQKRRDMEHGLKLRLSVCERDDRRRMAVDCGVHIGSCPVNLGVNEAL
jgi:tetratricopeptide (TPR) repeat protein